MTGWILVVAVVLLVGCVLPGGDAEAAAFKVTSASFANGGAIPAKFAMKAVTGGENRSPELHWSGAPKGTKSFVVACIDRHPIARGWVHWAVVDLPGTAAALAEGASGSDKLPAGARELTNSFGAAGWGGPQPPPGSGSHRYEFTVYALSMPHLDVADDAKWADVEKALAGKVLSKAMVAGTFER